MRNSGELILINHFEIKINGQNLTPDIQNAMLECVVETSLALPNMCSIRFQDTNLVAQERGQNPISDNPLFEFGASVEVRVKQEGRSAGEVIFEGEITHLEGDLAAHVAPTFVVRAMNKMHRLHQGRHQRSFLEMMDSEVAAKVVSEAGLSADIDSTYVSHPYTFQNNETNFEFLSRLARRSGCRLYAGVDQRIQMKKVAALGGTDVELQWGTTLRSFRTRASAPAQVASVEVRGWNPKTKQAISSRASSAQGLPTSDVGGQAGSKTAGKYGEPKVLVANQPFSNQDATQALAQSVLDEASLDFVEADGLCDGLPKLLAGKVVEVKGAGKRFSGKYLVTSATHTYNSVEGYTTTFSVEGKKPEGILEELTPRPLGMPRFDNVLVGIVTNNRKDPDGLGRVKVKFPTLTDDHESHWARLVAPMAGKDRGFYCVPEVGDEVLVAFENGDIHRPYIIGGLWNGSDVHPIEPNTAVPGNVDQRIFKTRVGHTLLFDDSNGNRKIEVKTKDGHTIVLDDIGKKIEAKTAGGHVLVLDDQGNKVHVATSGGTAKTTMESSGKVDHECTGNYTVSSKGKVLIEGLAGVEVKSPLQCTMEGTAGTNVKSTGLVTVQGSMVKIN